MQRLAALPADAIRVDGNPIDTLRDIILSGSATQKANLAKDITLFAILAGGISFDEIAAFEKRQLYRRRPNAEGISRTLFKAAQQIPVSAPPIRTDSAPVARICQHAVLGYHPRPPPSPRQTYGAQLPTTAEYRPKRY